MDVLNEALQELQNPHFDNTPSELSSSDIIAELLKNQRDGIEEERKLYHGDMKRIAKNIKNSIFDTNYCTLWMGYITNLHKSNKGTYINFYFHQQKVALHRLLYYNYIHEIDKSEYIKFKCEHKGYCCNVNCFTKYKYNCSYSTPKKKSDIPKTDAITICNKVDKNLFVHFD